MKHSLKHQLEAQILLLNIVAYACGFFLLVHVSAPLMGGKILIDSLAIYGGIFVVTFYLKHLIKRKTKSNKNKKKR